MRFVRMSSGDGEEYKTNQYACLYQQTYEINRELKAIIAKEANGVSMSQSTSQPKWNEYIKSHCDFMERQFSDFGCKDINQFLYSGQ